MSTKPDQQIDGKIVADLSGESHDFVTLRLSGQLLGIPVLSVHDVLNAQKITKVPQSPAWIAGALNLRGRIVTAIDLRSRLNLPPAEDGVSKDMNVVVEMSGHAYSLIIDQVGEVLSLNSADFESNPVTLDPCWREVSEGVYRLEEELLIVLDVDRLLLGADAGMAA